MAKEQRVLEMAKEKRPARTTLIEAAISFRQLMGLTAWLDWLRHQTIEAESVLRNLYQEDPGGPLAIDERRELNAAREKLKLAEEALDFYAAPDNWEGRARNKPSAIVLDGGDVAKEAMRKLADDTDDDENGDEGEGGE